ncbi:MAG TPA: alpha/beta hydrolase [Acidimicrobiales bacterium]|nr:alpha/beta hydrolase [Acidimicrobiales bacterium]
MTTTEPVPVAAPGQFFEVDGLRLHATIEGSGAPVVVLDSGAGGWSTAWGLVRPIVAESATVIAWDRPGLGWSDPDREPAGHERTVELLHGLLRQSGLEGPYVLVGHSIGGLHVRHYAARYPADIAGVVLVDPTTEHMHDGSQVMPRPQRVLLGAAMRAAKLKAALKKGKDKPGGADSKAAKKQQARKPQKVDTSGFPESVVREFEAVTSRPAYLQAATAEKQVGKPAALAIVGLTFPSVPLTVISSTGEDMRKVSYLLRFGLSPEWFAETLATTHRKIAQLSPHGKWFAAEGTTHNIPVDAPTVVAEAILDVVGQVRERA